MGVAAQIALVDGTKPRFEIEGIQDETLERPPCKAVRFEHDLSEAFPHDEPPAGVRPALTRSLLFRLRSCHHNPSPALS